VATSESVGRETGKKKVLGRRGGTQTRPDRLRRLQDLGFGGGLTLKKNKTGNIGGGNFT